MRNKKIGIKLLIGLGVFWILFEISAFVHVRVNGVHRDDVKETNNELEVLQPFEHLKLVNGKSKLVIHRAGGRFPVLEQDTTNLLIYEYLGDTLIVSALDGWRNNMSFLYIPTGMLKSINIQDSRELSVHCEGMDSLQITSDNAYVRLTIDTLDFNQYCHVDIKGIDSKFWINNGQWKINAELDHSSFGNNHSIDRLNVKLDNGSHLEGNVRGDHDIQVLDKSSTWVINEFKDRSMVVDRHGVIDKVKERQVFYAELTPIGNGDNRIDQLLVFSGGTVHSWFHYAAGIRFADYSNFVDLSAQKDLRYDSARIPVIAGQRYECWIDLDVKNQKASLFVKNPRTKELVSIYENAQFKMKVGEISRWSIIRNPNNSNGQMQLSAFGPVDQVGEYPEEGS